ncbi:hypothetical protein BU23DRAFT_71599 [Bimuria novae-zelandiae CBS 107.79]|uniref:Uncharacterized protein n=1 Tax=Bimuria novae-zelandiae CBS 107.79 TaxID=1447943 RepID=A0A6A5UIL3_9PLEO|nr:hypothetical protein BU23DRAFT_71599 [Bimuria novae-zelandiae CBS 107.79]
MILTLQVIFWSTSVLLTLFFGVTCRFGFRYFVKFIVVMGSTSLALAVSLASVFGAILLWALVYYTHRYIHQKCLQIKHWFHVFASPEDFGNERGEQRHSSEETRHREEREREKRHSEREKLEREREREERRKEKVKKKVNEWEDSDGTYISPSYASKSYMAPRQRRYEWDEGTELAASRPQVLVQPCVPAYLPAFVPLAQPCVPQYIPLAFPDVPYLDPSLTAPLPSGPTYPQATYQRARLQPYEEERTFPLIKYDCEVVGESSSSHSSAAAESAISPGEPQRVDFISICDEYPQIVKESLEREKKEKARQKRKAKAEAESSSSSTSSSASIEEVPRAHIPTATQRPAFQFPQWPYRMNPAHIPTSYPRQWMNNAESPQVHLPSYGPRRLRRDHADRRPGLAPSNAPPSPE